jgi:uncharacterized protein
MSRSIRWLQLALLVAAFTIVLELVAVPSAPLFGGMLGGLIYTLVLRAKARLPAISFRLAQGVVGVTVGAQVDWGRLVDLGMAWPAVLLVCFATLAISVAVGQLLRLHRGVSASTAAFSAIAGGASGMTAMADDFGADDRVVTVIQYLRVLVILSTLPLVVSWAFDVESPVAVTVTGQPDVWRDFLYTVLAVAGGLLVGTILRLPSPAILGGIGVGALLASVPGLDDSQVPPWAQDAAFLLIGIQVGLKFTRTTLRRLTKMMPTAFIVIALIIAICAALGVLLSELTGASRLDGYLATTPGGLPAVLAAASATRADMTFVSTVQVLRVIIVLVATPFLARGLFPRREG